MATRKPTLTATEREIFALRAKKAIDAGAVLWVSVPSTSRSNMSYSIRARLIGGSIDLWLNYWLAVELGATLNDRDDIRQNGCGTDRGFLISYDLKNILKRYGYEFETITWAWF